METFIQVLALAQPKDYKQKFFDEGEKLAALLAQALPQIQDETLAAFARALLYGMAQEQAPKVAKAPRDAELLREPLSEQEQRVPLARCRAY